LRASQIFLLNLHIFQPISILQLMKKRLFLSVTFALLFFIAHAGDITVKNFRYAGPFALQRPMMIDSLDLKHQPFAEDSFLNIPLDLQLASNGKSYSGSLAPGSMHGPALHELWFCLSANRYADAKIKVGKMKHYQLFVDGKLCSDGKVKLYPTDHDVVIKYLSMDGRQDSLSVVISSDEASALEVSTSTTRFITLADILDGKHLGRPQLSDDGRYLIMDYTDTEGPKNTFHKHSIIDLKTNRTLLTTDQRIGWLHDTDSYWLTRTVSQGKELVTVSLATGEEKVVLKNMDFDDFVFSPKNHFLLVQKSAKGPKDDADVHEYAEPDDRIPGWRDRHELYMCNLETGLLQPLTFGHSSVYLCDISQDERYLLMMVQSSRLTARPTSLYSLYRLNLQTLHADTLCSRDGFISDAKFSPNGTQVVIKGSPEAFGGIGENLPEGRIPSMYDYQLFIMDISTRKVKPVTRDFNPSVNDFTWSKNDGNIYFTADDRDYCHLYCLNPKSSKIKNIPVMEEAVSAFDLGDRTPMMAYTGHGTMNADRLYALDTESGKSRLIRDAKGDRLSDVKLGKCSSWDFVNSRGDTIYGYYFLPPDFNPSLKYPMIVNYYGGCSPTTRSFESRYPQQLYAAQGYVVYVIQPSGAVGFGQEFSSRHVNTAGEGPAQDIIEGTEQFMKEHPFVNPKKVGCIGASYGGFMTQYLQTKTNLFAAAISHAGISDHTSYWGEGYWGYSYSEVSMANSYPWANKELYVDRSPLFNADKIHTPILFLHGTADTNVPIGESIQMFNALKLLGRPTAFVVVEGENHHILQYEKRVKWQNTIFAWFAKWLQDDDSWWKSMYGKMSF
jgi:dipeptidyl aminopeptidase/acylaminoacyl peptidase